jgi:hypothetical protein
MKRFGFLLLLATTFSLVSLARADDDPYHRDNYQAKTSAVEMSVIGLAAASVTGAAAYLLRRRRGGSGK